MENRHKTARNAVKRCKRAERSQREAKLLVCNCSVSHGRGRSQSAGTVTAQTITWQTCRFVKRFDEPCAFTGKVKGQHRCGRMSCSHISGMLRAVTCEEGPSVFTWASWDRPLRDPRSGRRPLFGPFGGCFVIVHLFDPRWCFFDSFWLFVIFFCSFIFVCWFLAVFWCFCCDFVVLLCPSVFILWLFFFFLSSFVSFWCWFLCVVMFCCSVCCYFMSVVVVLCLCDHSCVFCCCVFVLVRYYVCKDAPPPP